MKAIEFNEYGGPDVLHLVEVKLTHPGPKEIRIKVHAAGVNPSDWKRREGQYRAFEDIQFPTGLGVEGSGIVTEVGPGVAGVAIGDAVFGFDDEAQRLIAAQELRIVRAHDIRNQARSLV